MKTRIELCEKLSEKIKADAFLFTNALSIQYLCGYFFNFETGPSPFHLIPSALLVIPSKGAYLIIADNEAGQISEDGASFEIIPYVSYRYEQAIDCTIFFNSQLHKLITSNNLAKTTIGIEPGSIPQSVYESLLTSFPDIKIVDVSREISELRMVKNEEELSMIRAATHLCDIGQEAVLKYAVPGMSEIELFNKVRAEMEVIAGKRVPMMADMVCGSRTSEGGGNPSAKRIKGGDLILSDLTPCLDGYWGDTCNTIVIGNPKVRQRDEFQKIKETLDLAIGSIRPGITAAEIDTLLRKNLQSIGEYHHHSGHGVGLAYHEEPRIVPYNNTVLAPNMVIALEPGIYMEDYGIRLEHLVVVTQSGCELISGFDHCFDQF